MWLCLGGVLLVRFSDVRLSKSLAGAPNATVLATGLPDVTTDSAAISRLTGSHDQIRLKVVAGRLVTHYTPEVEASDGHFYGLVALVVS